MNLSIFWLVDIDKYALGPIRSFFEKENLICSAVCNIKHWQAKIIHILLLNRLNRKSTHVIHKNYNIQKKQIDIKKYQK